MDTNHIFISIVIPVYNEEHRIGMFLASLIEYIGKKDFSFEIVIVDDGSRDETVNLVRQLLDEALPDTYTIIQLPQNLGKGAAIRKGMLEAQGDYIFFIDADGSTSITEIDRFIPCFSQDTDIYTARRTLKQKAPLKRKLFGYGYILLTNFLLRLDLSDITCGFKCYRKECVQTIFSRQRLNNWSFDSEDIFIARRHNYSIKEINVAWEHIPGSKVKVFKNVIVCGLDLLRIKLNGLRGLYS